MQKATTFLLKTQKYIWHTYVTCMFYIIIGTKLSGKSTLISQMIMINDSDKFCQSVHKYQYIVFILKWLGYLPLVLVSSHILKNQFNTPNRLSLFCTFLDLHTSLAYLHPAGLIFLHHFQKYACNLNWPHSACFSASIMPTGAWEMVSEKSRISKAGMLSDYGPRHMWSSVKTRIPHVNCISDSKQMYVRMVCSQERKSLSKCLLVTTKQNSRIQNLYF